MTAAASPNAPQKASPIEVKRAVMRAKRRHPHEVTHEELNITAMMDMMTIILVFLLKSLSSSAGNIPQSDDLRLPRSSALLDPSGALQIIISRVSVTVNGRSVGVELRNGYIDASQKRGGSAGYIINPLNTEMADQGRVARELAARTNQPFRGEIAVIADREIPARTIYDVLYTCGTNGFSNFQLLVLKSGAR